MKLVFIIILFYTSDVLSQFSVEKIQQIDGDIMDVQCYRGRICYVLTRLNSDYYFHTIKQNSDKNIISKFKLQLQPISWNETLKMVVNDDYTVYLFQIAERNNPENYDPKHVLWMKKYHWDNFKLIYKWNMNFHTKLNAVISKQSYLIVNSKEGIIAFAKDKTVPIAIFAFEEKYEFKFFETDPKDKTVYFLVEDRESQSDSVFWILEDEKKNILRVEKVPEISKGDAKNKVTSLIIWGGNLYSAFGYNDYKKPMSNITVWNKQGNEINVIHSQFNSMFHFFCSTDNRLYFTSEETFIYFIHNQTVNGVLSVFANLTIDKNLCVKTYKDVFFPVENKILKVNEVTKDSDNEVTEVFVSTGGQKKISSILMDATKSLWILSDQLYYLEDADAQAVAIPNLTVQQDSKMIAAKREIFVWTKNALYSVQKK